MMQLGLFDTRTDGIGIVAFDKLREGFTAWLKFANIEPQSIGFQMPIVLPDGRKAIVRCEVLKDGE